MAPQPQRLSGENFPLAASLIYDEFSARFILAAKEEGSRPARLVIGKAIAAAAVLLLDTSRQMRTRRLQLAWIPTSKRARRDRGGDFLAPIAKQVAGIIKDELNVEVGLSQLLFVRRAMQDQSGLSALDRARNLDSAFGVQSGRRAIGHVLLIDDVVTTGSTLREAVRALHERNLTVIGAATACASRLREPIR